MTSTSTHVSLSSGRAVSICLRHVFTLIDDYQVERRSSNSRSPSTSPLSDHWDVNAITITKPCPTTAGFDTKIPLPIMSSSSSSSPGPTSDTIPPRTHGRSASTSHRRRQSSISISIQQPHPGTSSLRTSDGPSDYSTLQSRIKPTSFSVPSEEPSCSIGGHSGLLADPASIPDQAKPHPETHTGTGTGTHTRNVTATTPTPDVDPRNEEMAHGRMASFTFGSKPKPLPQPQQQPLPQPALSNPLPPLPPPLAKRRTRPSSIIHTPRSSTSTSTSTTEVSRPPSLVVTSPFIPPELHSILDNTTTSPHESLPFLPSSSTATATVTARSRKHSHTRSNSISLPNLKLGRPTSLTASSSLTSSFPSSPISPDSDSALQPQPQPQPSRVITSRRLKFEPSGRGAEAELAKEESRRRALEKLTGISQRYPDSRMDVGESNVESIVLPSMDLETSGSSVVSDSPHLGFGRGQLSDQFGLPLLDHMPDYDIRSPSPQLSVPSNVTSPQLYGQSTLSRPILPLSRMSKSGGPGSIYEIERDMPSISKRISVTSALGVLQEEDENELMSTSTSTSASSASQNPAVGPVRHPLLVNEMNGAESSNHNREPPSTSTGLRQLQLLSPPSDKSTFGNKQSQSPNTFSLVPSDVIGAGESSHTPTKRSSLPLSITRHRPQSLHLRPSSPLAVEEPSSPVPGSSLTRSTRSRSSFGSLTPDRRTSRSGSLSYKKTPSGDTTTTTQRTSDTDTSVFGDIRTPLSVAHDLPLDQSTSTVNSHAESSSSSSAHHLSWGNGSPSPWHHPDVARSGRWSQSTSTRKIEPTITPAPPSALETPLKARRMSTSDSISLDWQGSSLDLALQRDTMEEDRDKWRTRCMAAEAKLEEERRERAILQSRIRKRMSTHLSI